jgi:uncharacterized protein with beta-barrel porin domain
MLQLRCALQRRGTIASTKLRAARRVPFWLRRLGQLTALAFAATPATAFALICPANQTVSANGTTLNSQITSNGVGVYLFNPPPVGFLGISLTNNTTILAACAGIEAVSSNAYEIANSAAGVIGVEGPNTIAGILLDTSTSSKVALVANDGTIGAIGTGPQTASASGIQSLAPMTSIANNNGSILIGGSSVLAAGISIVGGNVGNGAAGQIKLNGSFLGAGGITVTGDGASVMNAGLLQVVNSFPSGVSYGVALGPGSVWALNANPATATGSNFDNSGSVEVFATTTAYAVGLSASQNSKITNESSGGIGAALTVPQGATAKSATDAYTAMGVALNGGTTLTNFGEIVALGTPGPTGLLYPPAGQESGSLVVASKAVGVGSLDILNASLASTPQLDQGNNIIVNYGTIIVQGADRNYGILLKSNANQVTNQSGGMISVTGVGGGIEAEGLGNIVTNNGTIQLSGSVSNPKGFMDTSNIGIAVRALVAAQSVPGPSGNVANNNGVITSSAPGAVGILATGNGSLINNRGTISLTGVNGSSVNGLIFFPNTGIEVQGGNATISNTGNINVNLGIGVAVFGDQNLIVNSGTAPSGIQVTGQGSTAVMMNGTGNTLINKGLILAGAGGLAISDLSLSAVSNQTVTNIKGATIAGGIDLSHGTNESLTNSGLIAALPTFSSGLPTPPIGVKFIIGDAATNSGTFTQTSSGTLSLRFDSSGNNDKLTVHGKINAAGTLDLAAQPGGWSQQSFTGISALCVQGVACYNVVDPPVFNGRFDSVNIIGTPFFTATPIYNAQGLTVAVERIPFNAIPGLSRNELALGGGLEAGWNTASSAAALNFYNNILFNLPPPLPQAYDQLSGEGLTGVQEASLFQGRLFTGAVSGLADDWATGGRGTANQIVLNEAVPGSGQAGALGYAAAELPGSKLGPAIVPVPVEMQRSWRAWSQGFGGVESLDRNGAAGAASLDTRALGAAAGLDYQLGGQFLIGAAAGVASGDYSITARQTSGKTDSFHAAVYGAAKIDAAYATASLAYGRYSTTTTRTALGETEQASISGDGLTARLETGYRFSLARWTLTPFASFELRQIWQGAFAETSSLGLLGFNALAARSKSVTSLPLTLGGQVETTFDIAGGLSLTPYARLGWQHEFRPQRKLSLAFELVPAAAFQITGAAADANAARLGAGIKLGLAPNAFVFADFDSELGSHSRSYVGRGGLRCTW